MEGIHSSTAMVAILGSSLERGPQTTEYSQVVGLARVSRYEIARHNMATRVVAAGARCLSAACRLFTDFDADGRFAAVAGAV